jgi:hypothetical protein
MSGSGKSLPMTSAGAVVAAIDTSAAAGGAKVSSVIAIAAENNIRI